MDTEQEFAMAVGGKAPSRRPVLSLLIVVAILTGATVLGVRAAQGKGVWGGKNEMLVYLTDCTEEQPGTPI